MKKPSKINRKLINVKNKWNKRKTENMKLKKEKQTRKRIPLYPRNNKKYNRGGGLFNFFTSTASEMIKSNEIPPKNKVDNYNRCFTTTILMDDKKEYNVFYVIPQTGLLKNVNTTRAPIFLINGQRFNIKINDTNYNGKSIERYVNYLVKIGNEWYSILRVLGLNTGFFATVTYSIFFKLNFNIIFDSNNNSISIDDKLYNIITDKSLGLLRSTDSTIIELNSGMYSEITKEQNYDTYMLLRKFRNVQLAAFEAKGVIAVEATDAVVSNLFGF